MVPLYISIRIQTFFIKDGIKYYIPFVVKMQMVSLIVLGLSHLIRCSNIHLILSLLLSYASNTGLLAMLPTYQLFSFPRALSLYLIFSVCTICFLRLLNDCFLTLFGSLLKINFSVRIPLILFQISIPFPYTPSFTPNYLLTYQVFHTHTHTCVCICVSLCMCICWLLTPTRFCSFCMQYT